jgi:fumarate reductase subunit C
VDTLDYRVNVSWWALRVALGLMPIIAGVDKYFNKLTDWGMYLSPYAKVIPVSTATFMHVVGVVEIVAGVIVFSRWTKIGGYVVMLWLIAIAVNLLTTGMFYDLAVRDIEIAVGAFVLSQLTGVREGRDAMNPEPFRAEPESSRSETALL